MKPIKMPHNNFTYCSPQKWDKESYGDCLDLHVTKQDGIIYSYWSLSLKERIKLLFGRPLRLSIVGNSQPPVALDCED